MKITLCNDFHQSAYMTETDPVEILNAPHYRIFVRLTDKQTQEAREALCGIDDCTCAQHDCGLRGRQLQPSGHTLHMAE